MGQRIGVCSWSLQPTGPGDLVEKLQEVGVKCVQLALNPIRNKAWSEEETVEALRKAKIEIVSGMVEMKDEDYSTLETIRETGGVRIDENWEENLAGAWNCAKIASRLELPLVTFHAGFLPHDPADPERDKLVERVRAVADCFAAEGIDVGLETGQETAETLVAVLQQVERPRVGVNFDPANMILYGMGDPIEAFDQLAPYVKQLHVKDAVPSPKRGEWGAEVPVGEGTVDFQSLLSRVKQKGLRVPLVIEREAGSKRVQDARAAMRVVSGHKVGVA